MKALKKSCKSNWYLIAATFLMVICSEVLKGVMKHNAFPDSFDLLEFSGASLINAVMLTGGVILAFLLTFLFDNKFSGIFAAMFTVYAVLFSDLLSDSENRFYISLFIALFTLPFYYVNACLDSVMHTVFYYIMITALAVVMYEEIEFFVILTATVILFAVNRESVRQKSALAINYVFSVLAVIALVCMLVERMDRYFGIKFIEGGGYHLESLYLDTKPFGMSEYYYHRGLEFSSIYNLAKIFRHFGYVAGTSMCVVIALFALSFFVKCFGNRKKPCCASVLAGIMITLECIAGFFENFSIISGMRVGIPILSDGMEGYLIVGIMLGFMLVTDDIVNGFVKTLDRLFGKLLNKHQISESDKPHLTLVVSKEDEDV